MSKVLNLSFIRSPTTVLTILTVENIHCLKHYWWEIYFKNHCLTIFVSQILSSSLLKYFSHFRLLFSRFWSFSPLWSAWDAAPPHWIERISSLLSSSSFPPQFTPSTTTSISVSWYIIKRKILRNFLNMHRQKIVKPHVEWVESEKYFPLWTGLCILV